jgi:NADP-dependent 3-hydroxy acid dehydrogenase YdfG
VTGSDSGIGRATAITFAQHGADVLVHYHRYEQGAQETAARVRAADRCAEVWQADFADPAGVPSFTASYVTGSNYFVDGGLLRNSGGAQQGRHASGRKRANACAVPPQLRDALTLD